MSGLTVKFTTLTKPMTTTTTCKIVHEKLNPVLIYNSHERFMELAKRCIGPNLKMFCCNCLC